MFRRNDAAEPLTCSFGPCHCQYCTMYSEFREGTNLVIGSFEIKRFSCIVPSEHVTGNVVQFLVKFEKELIAFSDHLKVNFSAASFLLNMSLSISAHLQLNSRRS